MTALQPCANRRCLAPTAKDTDALTGILFETLCLEHAATALGLPIDALTAVARTIEPSCHHRGCSDRPAHITTWGNYCQRHWKMRSPRSTT